MKYDIFDLHCDTAYRMLSDSGELLSNTYHISLENAAKYGSYVQVMAHYCNRKLTDEEAFSRFLKMNASFVAQVEKNSDKAAVCVSFAEIEAALAGGRRAFIPAVEDIRLVCSDLSRLELLRSRGIRFATLVWGGTSPVGGAHNTEEGLSALGAQIVSRCFELGIIPDISHASEQLAEDVLRLAADAKRPVVATHSNAYGLYPHSRNLRDRHFEAVRDLGGVVGVSLCVSHLCDNKTTPCTVGSVVDHIAYYFSIGGEDTVCLGCDLDGTDIPDGMNNVSDLELIADAMLARGFTDAQVQKVLFGNAHRFAKSNL